MGLLPEGFVIADRYRVAGPVGCGGMAYVYRAEHVGLGTEVALKILAPEGAAGLRETRFLREARNAAGLDHPGCVRVLDYGIAPDHTRYLAMELIDGPTLRREMEEMSAMPVDYVLWIARELLDALAHAHGRGVLHRDVKPENVMFHTDGGGRRVVLIDFGLSRFEDDAVITAQGACVGSPSYIAPERLRGESYDGRADVYAVGVVLFEMLAGCRPFWGEGPLETARAHLQDPPFPLEVLREDLPEDVLALIHRALSKDPADRFESAVAMLAAVERARRALGHARRTPAPPARAATPPPVPAALATRESSASTTCVALARPRRGLLRRVWARFRYGRWRWRARGPEPSFA